MQVSATVMVEKAWLEERATKAMDALWKAIATVCSPVPKMELVAMVSLSAFTAKEEEELEMHDTSHYNTTFKKPSHPSVSGPQQENDKLLLLLRQQQ